MKTKEEIELEDLIYFLHHDLMVINESLMCLTDKVDESISINLKLIQHLLVHDMEDISTALARTTKNTSKNS